MKNFKHIMFRLWKIAPALMLVDFANFAYAADKTLEEAHETLIADRSYVFDYAEREAQQVRPVRAQSNSGFWDALGGVLQVLFWVAIALGVCLLLFFIITEAIRLRNLEPGAVEKSKTKPAIVPNYQPEAQAAKSLLGDVDDLAAQGRYEEAIHTLLLRSISDIRKNRPKAVPKAMTSREISHISILSDLARQAFRNIGDRVERSYFGGRKLSKEDFERSRADYETFAFERKQAS